MVTAHVVCFIFLAAMRVWRIAVFLCYSFVSSVANDPWGHGSDAAVGVRFVRTPSAAVCVDLMFLPFCSFPFFDPFLSALLDRCGGERSFLSDPVLRF